MMRSIEIEVPIEVEKCLITECPLKRVHLREITDLEVDIRKLREENEQYKRAVSSLLVQMKELLKPDHAALNFLRSSLSRIQEVRSVYYFIRNGVINFRISIEKGDFNSEMKIAEALSELLAIFQNLRFDFMVIPEYGKKLDRFLPSDAQKLSL